MFTWKTDKELRGKYNDGYNQIGYEDRRQLELAQDCVQWQAMELVMNI
jgi:hypothetical protein